MSSRHSVPSARAVATGELLLAGPQLDPADLARDRLRQVGELESPHPLPRLQVLPRAYLRIERAVSSVGS